MITSQLIGQVTESLIPYIMYRSRITKVAKEGKKIVMKTADLSDDIERQGTQEQYLVSNFTHAFPSVSLRVFFQTRSTFAHSQNLSQGNWRRVFLWSSPYPFTSDILISNTF